MKWLFIFIFLILPSTLLAGPPPKTRFSLGVDYTGGHIHYGLSERLALEARYLTGRSEAADRETVSSDVFGLRGLYYLQQPKTWRWYAGAEAAATRSKTSVTTNSIEGQAFGGFMGMEMYVRPRISVTLDIGPYYLTSKVSQSQTSRSEVEVVVNSSVNLYLF